MLMMGRIKASVPILRAKYLLSAVLAIIACFQVYTLASGSGRLWLSRIQRTYRLTSMERIALFYIGSSGADFMDFLIEVVPEDGSVVVTPQGVIFAQQSLLQFFLMPRSVPHCGCDNNVEHYSSSCIACLQNPKHYVPAIGEFPPAEVMEGRKTFIPYPVDSYLYHGIYIPLQSAAVQAAPLEDHADSLLAALVIDIAVCAAIFALGYMIAELLTWARGKEYAIAAGLPLGMGALSWTTFLVSWAGVPITLLTFIVVYAVLMGTIALIRRRYLPSASIRPSSPRNLRDQIKQLKQRPLFLGLLFITVLFSLIMIVITVGRSFSTTDGIANWAIKGYAIALEGTASAGLKWGAHLITYPQNIHLTIALFRLVDGDILPGSKLIYALIAVSLMYGCYAAWRRRNVPDSVALLGLLIFFSVPLIYVFATLGWANFIFTAYLVLGTIYWCAGLADRKPGILTLGGALLAFSAWTRPEGIGFALVIGLGSFFVLWIKNRRRYLPYWILLLLLIPGSYLLFGAAAMKTTEIGSSVGSFLTSITSGEIDLSPLSIIFQYALGNFQSISTWGYFTWLILLLFFFTALFRRKQISEFVLSISSAVLVSFLYPIGIFFVAYFDKSASFINFLNRQFDRAMMPTLLLLFFILIVMSSRSTNRQFQRETESLPFNEGNGSTST
jgi:hypothetical protein